MDNKRMEVNYEQGCFHRIFLKLNAQPELSSLVICCFQIALLTFSLRTSSYYKTCNKKCKQRNEHNS